MIQEKKQNTIEMEMRDQIIKMQCQICLNEELNSPYCMLDCPAGHIYHVKCLQTWVKKGNKTCPTDRKPIQKVLANGQIKKVGRSLSQQERCFLCNQAYEVEKPKLKCLVCHTLPCHSACLTTISTSNIPDFNRYQTCQQCQYELRQWSILQYQHLHRLNNKLSTEYYRIQREIQKHEKQIRELRKKQQQIYQTSEDVNAQLSEIERNVH